jgi:hypothetical protein
MKRASLNTGDCREVSCERFLPPVLNVAYADLARAIGLGIVPVSKRTLYGNENVF